MHLYYVGYTEPIYSATRLKYKSKIGDKGKRIRIWKTIRLQMTTERNV